MVKAVQTKASLAVCMTSSMWQQRAWERMLSAGCRAVGEGLSWAGTNVLVSAEWKTHSGPVAQWITRLTTDQKILGSTPGWLVSAFLVSQNVYANVYVNTFIYWLTFLLPWWVLVNKGERARESRARRGWVNKCTACSCIMRQDISCETAI